MNGLPFSLSDLEFSLAVRRAAPVPASKNREPVHPGSRANVQLNQGESTSLRPEAQGGIVKRPRRNCPGVQHSTTHALASHLCRSAGHRVRLLFFWISAIILPMFFPVNPFPRKNRGNTICRSLTRAGTTPYSPAARSGSARCCRRSRYGPRRPCRRRGWSRWHR